MHHRDTFIAFGVYFLILLIIGLSAHRRSRTESDYIMGGRSLNFWLTALSAQAADMSAWLFMGFAALIYMNGLTALWLAIGLVVGNFLNWTIVAPGLQKYGKAAIATPYLVSSQNDLKIATAFYKPSPQHSPCCS